jgi:hypothetical protein
MVAFDSAPWPRRRFLAAAAAACALPAAQATPIYTPHDMAQLYAQRVTRRLAVPENELALYGGMTEMLLMAEQRRLIEPQYLLVVDNNPQVQAALLFWRLWAGSYRFIGASPVSTGGPVRPDHFETPQGVFAQAPGTDVMGGPGCEATRPAMCRRDGPRVYDFGWQRARSATGRGRLMSMRLQALAAEPRAERKLGLAISNGCVLLPASLVAFLDEYGLLDGPRDDGMQLPYRGRYMMVLDSERLDRPEWSPAPRA